MSCLQEHNPIVTNPIVIAEIVQIAIIMTATSKKNLFALDVLMIVAKHTYRAVESFLL